MQILGISYLIWWLLSIWGIGIYFLIKVRKLRLMYKNVDLKSSGADADVQLIKFLSIIVMILASLFSLLLFGKSKHSDAFISGAYVGLSLGLIYAFIFFLELRSKLQKQSNGLGSSFKELEKKIEEEKRKMITHY